MKQLLVIGTGVAGAATVEHLLDLRADLEITMFDAENSRGVDTLAWCQQRGIGLQLGVRVVDVDVQEKTVTADDGSITPFDVLLLATGTAPSLPHVIGVRKRNVFTGADMMPVTGAQSERPFTGNVVVITDSLEGLDTARELAAYHSRVFVALDPDAATRDRLDGVVAKHLLRTLEAAGVEVITDKRVTAIIGNGIAESLDFEDGSELRVAAVFIPSVVRPDTELARRAGIAVDQGILVDDHMRSSSEDVFAAGECVQHRRVVYRDRRALLEQARVAAATIAGDRTARYKGSVQPIRRRILGIEVFTAGEFDEKALPGSESLRCDDPVAGSYKKLLLRDGRLSGVVLAGDLAGSDLYIEWITSGIDLSSMGESLLFPGAPAVCNITKSFTAD